MAHTPARMEDEGTCGSGQECGGEPRRGNAHGEHVSAELLSCCVTRNGLRIRDKIKIRYKIVGFHDATRLATLRNSAMHGPLTPRHKGTVCGDDYLILSLSRHKTLSASRTNVARDAIEIRRSRPSRRAVARPSSSPSACHETMRSGRPSFIALPVKSDKALEDIRNLLAGTCPAPPTDEVTAANVGSRSNAFAAAEGAPTDPTLTLPEPAAPAARSRVQGRDGLGSRSLAARRGPSALHCTTTPTPPRSRLPSLVLWPYLLCRHQGVLGRDPAQRRNAGARGGSAAEREGKLPHLYRSALRVLGCEAMWKAKADHGSASAAEAADWSRVAEGGRGWPRVAEGGRGWPRHALAQRSPRHALAQRADPNQSASWPLH